MSENKDVYQEAKSQMRLSERIAAFVPGFRGYKEKELRRESDKLIRNHLYLKLNEVRNDIKAIFQTLADRRYMDVLTDMDRLNAKMDRMVEKINHASYGYSGFFDVVKVKEENLDRMIDFDNKLLDGINSLAAEVNTYRTEIAGNEFSNSKQRIQNIMTALDSLEATFDSRQEIILGAT
jgi:hypothetical protein